MLIKSNNNNKKNHIPLYFVMVADLVYLKNFPNLCVKLKKLV